MFRNKLTGTMTISGYAFVIVFLGSVYIPELRAFLPAAVIALAIVVNVVMLHASGRKSSGTKSLIISIFAP